MHLLWVNESASLVGGCERYIAATVAWLHRRHGFRASLLHQGHDTDPAMTHPFLATGGVAFPLVTAADQLASLAPDAIFVHRLSKERFVALRDWAASRNIPLLRFFHDYQLFCLREHKYTTLGRRTCDETVGPQCYSCLGFVQRADRFPGFRLRTVGNLLAEQRLHQQGCAAYLVASSHMALHLIRHGFDETRIRTLPLYAPDPGPAETATVREAERLLYAGQLVTGKGVDTLLEAMALLPSTTQLDIAGSGRCEKEYRALARTRGLSARVHFLGRLAPDALAEAYRRARAVVVPSRFPEPFGLVGVEAMSFGTPVVATGTGGMGEWLEDGVTGLNIRGANDPSALAEALERVLSDDLLAFRLGQEARERYEERFRPERHCDALAELFSQLAGRRLWKAA